MEKKWTAIALLKEAQQYFERKGIVSARLDAELLLAFSMKKDRVQLYADFDSPVVAEELAVFRELSRRRAAREPLAYILGQKEFWSMSVGVDRQVLIPRPETEVLVEEVLRILKRRGDAQGFRFVLDLGTGSGAVALALAKEDAGCRIVSADLSPGALHTARKNILLHGLEGRVHLVCGDALNPFLQSGRFDAVVSNPPYICSDEIKKLAPEIRDYEPRSALDGGRDGLDFYRGCIPRLAGVLKRGGWVALEVGNGQAPAVGQLLEDVKQFSDIQSVPDYSRCERVVLAKKNQ